jgi:hypothetical protein
MTEFKVDEDLLNKYQVGTLLNFDILEGVDKVTLIGRSK